MIVPGGWELVLIALLIMVLFGFKRLPSVARDVGRSLHILKTEVAPTLADEQERR